MDFSSFDLDNSKDATSQQHGHESDTYEQDTNDFFAFIDPSNFHTSGSEQQQLQHQQQQQQQHQKQQQESTYLLPPNPSTPAAVGTTTRPLATSDTHVANSYSLMSPMHMNINEYQTPLQQPISADYPEDEEFFTPLISPAIPPNYYTNLRNDTNFSPLTSPALGPQQHVSVQYQHLHDYQITPNNTNSTDSNSSSTYSSHSVVGARSLQDGQSPEELQERLAFIERQQQQLRSHMQHTSTSTCSTTIPATTSAAQLSSLASPVHKPSIYASNNSNNNNNNSINSISSINDNNDNNNDNSNNGTNSNSSSNSNNNNNNNSAPSSASNTSTMSKSKQSLRHKIAMSSPQFNPTTHVLSPGMHPLHNYQQFRNNNSSNTGSQNSSHSFSSDSLAGYHNPHMLAPATPSLLMKLGNGMHNNSGNTNNDHNLTNSPLHAMMPSSHDPIVDNMMALPDAMLPPSVNDSSTTKKTTKRATVTTSSIAASKRRRISYPRSAFTPPALLPSASYSQPQHYTHSPHHHQQQQQQQQRHSGNAMASFDQGIAALISPAALRPQSPAMPSPSLSASSAASAKMMSPSSGPSPSGMSSSPRALKPLISPSLQPNGKRLTTIDEHEAATILASKSNYQTLREGRAKSLGIDFNTNIQSGMENRRSAHKAAEQRRRDTLKQNFDALRMELLEALVAEDELQCIDDEQYEEGKEKRSDDNKDAEEDNQNEKHHSNDGDLTARPVGKAAIDTSGEKQKLATSKLEREKKVKQMSKVVLLQHSYEYMLRLKHENRQKDAKLEKMSLEIQVLRKRLGMEPITEEERQAAEKERREEMERRLARLKRLEDIVEN